ncbi:MAG: nuclear transport factor 2 family protein [Chloroflexota bacterium]
MTRRLRTGLALAGPVLAALLVVGGTAGLAQSPAPVASTAAAPVLADPVTTGTELVTRYAQLIMDGDTAGLAALLDTGFQIARANGDHYDRDAYLALGLPTIESFTVDEVDATQAGPTLVVFWTLDSVQVVDGVQQPSGPLPRLTTFAWIAGDWKLVAHANFGSANRADAPSPSPAPAG